MTTMDSEEILLRSLLPGLEEAKRAIEGQIADILRRLQKNDEPVEKKTRIISEETRQQRREFMAKARQAKLEKLRAAKAPVVIGAGKTK